MLNHDQLKRWRRDYRVGKILTNFVARDIRRDIEIVDVADVDNGILTVKTRTWNLLHAIRGRHEKPPFGDVRQVEIEHLWDWDGEQWGGEVPESTDKQANHEYARMNANKSQRRCGK